MPLPLIWSGVRVRTSPPLFLNLTPENEKKDFLPEEEICLLFIISYIMQVTAHLYTLRALSSTTHQVQRRHKVKLEKPLRSYSFAIFEESILVLIGSDESFIIRGL